MLCYVIELYRVGFKRLLDIQSVYRFKFTFVLNLNITGVGKEYLMTLVGGFKTVNSLHYN